MKHAIVMEGIAKGFQHKRVIQPLDLTIEKGGIFGLLGPSGCGKTTLIKMIAGLIKPDAGSVTVLGMRVPNEALLMEIGYMAQSDALYAELTGAENLDFFAKLYHLSKKERSERIRYAAEIVGLTNDLNTWVAHYSGGMKRRLSLAIALIQNPEILILDEPTVGIDPRLKRTIWQELERLRDEERKTIVITTHVMDEAERCDELAMLREGAIIASGTPGALKGQYAAESLDDVFLQIGGGR
ncbi:ABC transporter ATP-binding protein [Peribacillus sp. SI8-4]|uniref:ABC transporter ATP-binding protein n=1 Tax=Peribacillus sp. SI8-4 TaxID=3048009 RepID=UPI0025538A59|nr:ABC transporter ATP-binding protein [Peribacillus sp. SI8-4]